jgi:hypothetical protein
MIALSVYPGSVHGQDALYFTAIQDARQPILDLIAAERTRIDVAAWWFTDAVISDAIVRRYKAGVAVRFIGDASAYRDANTKVQIDYLASQGIPIRFRSPAGIDGIVHWKCGIFAGQKNAKSCCGPPMSRRPRCTATGAQWPMTRQPAGSGCSIRIAAWPSSVPPMPLR